MYCVKCGSELPETAFYCMQCGTATGRAPEPVRAEPIMRSATDKKIAGVCGGLAKYLSMDPTIMRLLWLLLTFGLPPAGVLGYIAAWILMPMEPVRVYVTPQPTTGTV
jgi:phage shock protein PspC (stress-responsive transcriptional regulator)